MKILNQLERFKGKRISFDVFVGQAVKPEHALIAMKSKKFNDYIDKIDPAFEVERLEIYDLTFAGPPSPQTTLFMWAGIKHKFMQFPAKMLIRGGSVAILPLFRVKAWPLSKPEWYTIIVRQPRVQTGQTRIGEIPAGMLDSEGHFAGVAAKEIEEELGITIDIEDLRRISPAAGIYPSAGGSEEVIHTYVFEKDVTTQWLTEMQGRRTGAADEDEDILLEVIPVKDILTAAPQDYKALGAVTLYLQATGVNLLALH